MKSEERVTDIDTVLLAVNQTLEVSIHMSARLIIGISPALRSLEEGRAAS